MREHFAGSEFAYEGTRPLKVTNLCTVPTFSSSPQIFFSIFL